MSAKPVFASMTRPNRPQERPTTPRPTWAAAWRKRLAQIPARQRPIFLRAWAGKSRKTAIRAFCLECVGYESAEVNRCTAPACPLCPYREDRL